MIVSVPGKILILALWQALVNKAAPTVFYGRRGWSKISGHQIKAMVLAAFLKAVKYQYGLSESCQYGAPCWKYIPYRV